MPSTSPISRSASTVLVVDLGHRREQLDQVAAVVAVRLALGGGERWIACGCAGERDGDDPVDPRVVVGRQRSGRGRPECFCGGEVGAFGPLGAAPFDRRPQREVEQLVLVREVVHERAGGPAGLGGDLAHRGGIDTGTGDHASSCLGQFLAALVGVDDLRH